jgi:hypothetical protein
MKKEITEKFYQRYKDVIWNPTDLAADIDYDSIAKSSRLPWLQLDIHVPTEQILAEIQNIKHLCVPHRDDYAENAGWESFCIHGKSWDATREDSYYSDSRPFQFTKEAQTLMPITVEYFKNQWPYHSYRRVRVMRLKPNGYISVHKDSDVSQLSPINIAITHPSQCGFVMEKYGTVPFVPGRAMLLDVSNYHTVFNHSDQDRWHIIVHQIPDNNFQDLVVKSYKTMYNTVYEKSNNNNPRRSEHKD